MRRERLLLLAVLAAGLALRLGYLASQRDDILFEHPILDEQRYADAARALADGRLDEDRPYWQPPGIIFVTAAVLRVAGPSLLWPRVLQALIGTAACLLLFALARRRFSFAVSLAAAAVLALHGVAIFSGSELLPAIWILFFDLLALWLLDEPGGPARALAAGLALGLSAIFSPVILPFVIVAAFWLRKPVLVIALLAGVIAPIAPVTARNFAHGGEVVLISTNGGLNLFIGNNEHYRETFALRPGRHWEELTTQPQRRGITAPGAASSYFTHEVSSFVQRKPLTAAGLYLRKLYLYFNGGEIPRDSDVALSWRHFPDGILLPLALVGAALFWPERRRLALLYAFLAWQALIAAAFFVTARHRVPALGVLALFAAAGVTRLRPRWWPILLLLLVVCNLPTWESALSFSAEADFYRGVAFARELHDPATAADYFRRAAALEPKDPRPWFELGNALDQLGRGREAVEAWQQAAEADPWDSRARRRMSSLMMRAGDLDGAAEVLRAQLEGGREPAHYAPDWLNLAFLRVKQGRLDEARKAMEAARAADPEYFAAHAPGLPAEVRSALGLQGP